MPTIVENVPFVSQKGTLGRKPSQDGYVSESSRMVGKLRSLSKGQCVTLLPETDHPKELERKRTHWANAATRAGIKVVSRLVTTDAGDRAVRIWRVDD